MVGFVSNGEKRVDIITRALARVEFADLRELLDVKHLYPSQAYMGECEESWWKTFLMFQKLVENQFSSKIGTFQCDGGGEFTSTKFTTHLKQCGIQQYISCPHTPQQNGLAERRHRQITELGLTLLFQGKLPQKYWVEAFYTANFLSNLLPSSALDDNRSPFEVLYKKQPDYSALRTFGCSCFPTLRDYAVNKFDPRSLHCVFLGYNDKYKGYRCLYPPTGRVYISRHVLFEEESFPFHNIYQSYHPAAYTPSLRAWQRSFIQPQTPPSATSNESSTSTIQVPLQLPVQRIPSPVQTPQADQPRALTAPSMFSEHDFPELGSARSGALATPVTSPPRLSSSPAVSGSSAPMQHQSQCRTPHNHPMVTRLRDGIRKPNPKYALNIHRVSHPEPRTVTAALKHKGWNEAMGTEITNCKETNTWSLVPKTPEMHVLGSRWVYRTKLNADGTVKGLRARVVAKGNHQEEGVDYLETYSPVVRTATVRMVLHLATIMNWEIKQMDVQNAFLHGDLAEIVYMTQPAGFVDKNKPKHVCKLHKSIYGLKQSPRAWFDKFSSFLLEFGFVCSIKDPSLFICNRDNNIIMLLLYVDDMAITGNNSAALDTLLVELNKQFRMKDLGQLHYFLGIQVRNYDEGLFLS